jgi:hypothetical protein
MSQRVPFRISTRPTTKLGSRGSALEEGLEEEMEEMEVMEVMEVIEGMAGMENMGERMEEGMEGMEDIWKWTQVLVQVFVGVEGL